MVVGVTGTRRNSGDESEASGPKPLPPRFARSPSPACAGEDAGTSILILAARFFVRTGAWPRHCTKAAPKKREGGGAPTGAYALLTAPHRTSVTACRCSGRGARHAIATLPPQRASGALASRRSVAALARFLGLAQLRAALTGICRSLRRHKPLLLASSSRPDRSAGEAGSEAARERFARPRAGTALAPPSGSHLESALRERVAAFLFRRETRIQEIPPVEAIALIRRYISRAVCSVRRRRNCDTLP